MTRTVEIRYKIVRNDAEFGELYALESGVPVLRMDDGGEIKTSLAGRFAPAPEADWLTDQIRPELIIDGVAHPLGVYLPASVIGSEDESAKELRIEAYDRCWILRDHKTETLQSFAAGTNYLTAVEQLLTAAGFALVIATPTAATLTETREDWDLGTSYLSIINELLGEINYKPIWFDAQGYAVLEPWAEPTAENLQHVLDGSNIRSLMLPRLQRETDVYSAPNVFLAICSNPDKTGSMSATAVNDNPMSPLSTVRRGRRILRVEHVNNIASQTELEAYAKRLMNENMYAGETYTVSTALLPGYGVADVTALNYDEIAAICIEHAWEMELRPGGTMTHTLRKVVPALG